MNRLRNKTIGRIPIALAALAALAWISQPIQAITLNFSNVENAQIVFAGGGSGDFSFSPGIDTFDFEITGGAGGGAAAIGLRGNIGGTFTMGAILSPFPGAQTAMVSGMGTVEIEGGLTGTIEWGHIASFGTGGIINVDGIVNLTGITYPGVNPALENLALNGDAVMSVTFQFTGLTAQNLSQLVAQGGATSYSGAIHNEFEVQVPDAGSSAILLGVAFLGLCGLQRRRK
jgi:hypothetical protein